MPTGISVITWCNDLDTYMNWMLTSLASPYQFGFRHVQYIAVTPDAQARNLGHAYNLAQAIARHEIKLYIHQDVKVLDRHFFEKLHEMFLRPKVGAVGIIGTTEDTGAGHFHAMPSTQRGRYAGFFEPEQARVNLVDGFLFATTLNVQWCEDYIGPHMAVEDACMQIRGQGKQIWTVDSLCDHKSGGTVDGDYWRSVKRFRKRWKKVLPRHLYSIKFLKEHITMGLEQLEADLTVEQVEPPAAPETKEAASG
jgi:hypothetical protein